MTMRERGEGSVFLRGKTFWIQYSKNGRVFRETSRSVNRKEAVKLLRRRLAEIRLGRHAPEAERVTFTDLEHLLLDDWKLNGRKSADRAKRSLTHLRDAFGSDRAVGITADRLVSYANARHAAGAAPGTVAYELAILRRAFRLAVRVGRLVTCPLFPSIRVSNTRQGFVEAADFAAVHAALPGHAQGPVAFAWFTGWRIRSEVLSLRWSQVDLDAGIVRLEPGTTKNKEGREFPVSDLPPLAELLQRQRAYTDKVEQETGQIVPWVWHRGGKPVRSIANAWRGARRRAGQPHLLLHDLRRSAVRNLERAGVPRSVSMKLVGHRTEAIYIRYSIVAHRDLADGVARLAVLHQQPTGPRSVLPFPASSDTVSDTIGQRRAAKL